MDLETALLFGYLVGGAVSGIMLAPDVYETMRSEGNSEHSSYLSVAMVFFLMLALWPVAFALWLSIHIGKGVHYLGKKAKR